MRNKQALDRLARSQDGVLTTAQVLALGYTDAFIEAQINARRWQRPHRGVLVTVTGALTRRQRERVALLTPGLPVALSHGSAGRRWGLWVPDDDPIHVTVAYGQSAVDRPGVVLHRTRAFPHIVVDGDMPVVSAPDTCVDLAVAEPDARAAMRRLIHCALAMRVRTARLRLALSARRPRRYRRALAAAVEYLEAGVNSELEMRYALDVEDAHGLPRAERQFPVAVDGHRRFEDLIYRMPHGDLIVRLDGWRYHSDRRVALVDRRRDAAAQLAGRARLAFGWEEVSAPCRTAAEVATTLRGLGWEPASPHATCECLGGLEPSQALTRR